MAKTASSGQRVSKSGVLALILVIIAAGVIVLLVYQGGEDAKKPQTAPAPAAQEPVPAARQGAAQEKESVVIDYNKVDGQGDQDQDMANLMDERKAKYGVDQSLDMIVNEDESIKVGEYTVSMKEIMDDVKLSRGEIVVDEINPDGKGGLRMAQNKPVADGAGQGRAESATTADGAGQDRAQNATAAEAQEANLRQGGTASKEAGGARASTGSGSPAKPAAAPKGRAEFGVYVVQPGDNIWNIHFKLLDEFFAHQGVRLSPLADEPSNNGFSSGVGKILKFSENMVAIYNLKTRQVDQDLNMIQPLSKVVVYNMTHVFDLLRQIDYSQVNMIQFDGDTLWLPVSGK
ncbi:hypothetical protein SAMN02745216_02869 [Desulfatibacillum alkenivorans DSM 16219]|jgi:hypothetical protein|uniref:Uncharacterized protein n=1 Tax=Desulfatibacillum alkenivorans DSM 16219 TaxID=1121393 RepID=A0A1M6PQ74_9BACT|nr:hypothetical protein [Desulfatibacillum alkenivorans]SHK10120.1 hypothetical protein SAMN02745216_02869 [Desulfatibacillum alkenivorans DSM 16219]